MGERWLITDFQTGHPLGEVRPVAGSWSHGMADTAIECTIPDPAGGRDLLAQLTPWRHALVVDMGGRIMAGGPIVADTWNGDDRTTRLVAAGAEAYLDRRTVLPQRVATEYGWDLYDETNNTPAHWARTIVGLAGGDPRTLPAVVAWVITQAVAWPNSPAIRGVDNFDPGDRTLWVEGIDFRTVRSVIDDVTRETGAEWDLVPEWRDGRVEWQILVGDPDVSGNRYPSWSDRTVTGLSVARDGSRMVTHQHVTGGGDAGVPMTATRVQAGPVMLEAIDSSRRTESDAGRLGEWADTLLAADRQPWITVAFDAPATDAHLWGVGDTGYLSVDAPHLLRTSNGATPVRVAQVSGHAGAGQIHIQCHPMMETP